MARGGHHSSAHAKHSTADTTAATVADSRSLPRTYPTTLTAADPATAASSVGRRRENPGHRIASLRGLRQNDIRRTNQGRLRRKLGIFIADDYGRRS